MMLWLPAAQAETTIVILRHAEKPELGLGQLSCQGLNRALALAPLLLSRYGKPTAIYAPNPSVLKQDKGASYAYVRPLATIEPLAIRTALPVTLAGGMTETLPLVAMIAAQPSGTHIIAWEHHWGETLARQFMTALGGDPAEVPQWSDDDFDSLFVIRVRKPDNGLEQVTFSHEHQELDGMPADCVAVPSSMIR